MIDITKKLQELGLDDTQVQEFIAYAMEMSRYITEEVINVNFSNEEIERIEIEGDREGWDDLEKTDYIDEQLKIKTGKTLFDYLDTFWETFFLTFEKGTTFALALLEKLKKIEDENSRNKVMEEYIETYQNMKLREILSKSYI